MIDFIVFFLLCFGLIACFVLPIIAIGMSSDAHTRQHNAFMSSHQTEMARLHRLHPEDFDENGNWKS